METKRQQKISRLIQKELSEVFLLQTKAMHGILISVSSVKISSDLSLAKVYLSIFPSNKGKELLENIDSNAKSIRYEMGQRLGKQLRIIPHFVYYLDDSLDYLENIDRLLNKVNEDDVRDKEQPE